MADNNQPNDPFGDIFKWFFGPDAADDFNATAQPANDDAPAVEKPVEAPKPKVAKTVGNAQYFEI